MSIFLNGSGVDITARAVHLGILRDTTNKVDIAGKISMGSKTAYSLIGAGLHEGLESTQNGHIWPTFVGLECSMVWTFKY